MKELVKIKYWIFDLDNTLYSGQTKVFSEVDKKMSASLYLKKFECGSWLKQKKFKKNIFMNMEQHLSGLMKQDGI